MVEFAAGIVLGGSIGAVIMGALISQSRAAVTDEPSASAPTRARITRLPAARVLQGVFVRAKAGGPSTVAARVLH